MQYIERFIERDLLNWKKDSGKYALEITGCRQVGKTTMVQHFAEQNYSNVVYVNVAADADLNTLAQASEYNVLNKMSAFCKQRGLQYCDDNTTVLILDEIQESKALYERIRLFNRHLSCDVIVTGSYLKKTKEYFQPAGDLITLRMYPLSYEEYLNYFGLYQYYRSAIIEDIYTKHLGKFREVYEVYLQVGGYPAAFNAYLERRDLTIVFEQLLNSFKSEFNINASRSADFDKVDQMFEVICKFLCREKKGAPRAVATISKLTEQEKSKRISVQECNDLLAWMSAARLINYCDKIDLTTGEVYPAERFYFEDIGFFNYLCDIYFMRKETTNGILTETFVYKQLAENNFTNRFYRTRPAFAIDGDYELDFCVRSRLDNKVYGIEVKTGKNSGISIKQMLEKKYIDFAVYAKGDCGIGSVNNTYTIPVFLLGKFNFDKGGRVERKSLPRLNKDAFSMDEMNSF